MKRHLGLHIFGRTCHKFRLLPVCWNVVKMQRAHKPRRRLEVVMPKIVGYAHGSLAFVEDNPARAGQKLFCDANPPPDSVSAI
ncbi:MAG: hypothetical protein OXU61_01325 [Gammaproteobacteria bacterium]|nr:hypothetical protein [Gammaproteobacteria bacterium]